MTVRVETPEDDGKVTAISYVRVQGLPGAPEAHVRLMRLAGGPEAGITVFSGKNGHYSTLWLAPEQAYYAADVLDMLAVWPADAIAALAAAVRRSAEAVAPAGAEPGALL